MAKQPTHYDPKAVEAEIYRFWLDGRYFHPTPDERGPDRRFVIVIPPPNVTGALHLGHAINNVLQDILIRRHRMAGCNTLWLPGTDHAGIATQAVVERRIYEQERKTRHDLGRDGLVQRIWDWKDEYEARILQQLRLMGCSCDWDRARFTLDATCAQAVRYTFFRLFSEGLIYRGLRLVNWDTQLQTAVADDEVYHETVQGHLWHIKYPLESGRGHLTVATTRPETMLGDTAMAVHPDDERYKHLIGQFCILPLVGRRLPIIADPMLVRMDFGSGCVKVTPAHDPNDYQCGQRHGLEIINILTPDGRINEHGGRFAGLDRDVARREVVAALQQEGRIQKIEPYQTEIGHSDRSQTAIEPYLTEQWFVRMGDVPGGVRLADGSRAPGLAQMAMDAVRDGRVRFFPERYAKTYLDWLGEKRDWCISRQLWWGHRIPIWYCRTASQEDLERAFGGREDVCWRPAEPDGGWLICARDADLASDAVPGHQLVQDPDVLDTWFSSALWPHSTLGWPQDTQDLRYYYPTTVLITMRDIITLWVARMVITGLYNTGQVPFPHVYIHPKILDGQGRTMSKSLGNGVDPVDIIEKCGADALRFSLAYMCTETQDLRMPVEPETLPDGRVINASPKFEIGRNFCNKLWQAATGLVLPSLADDRPRALTPDELQLADRWILSALQGCIEAVDRELGQYRCGEALGRIYRFFWHEYCDWYLEMVKPRLRAGGDDAQAARQVLVWCLDQVLRLVHPFAPFASEAIWQRLQEAAPRRGVFEPGQHAKALTVAAWPQADRRLVDEPAEAQMTVLQTVVRSIRDIRAYINSVRARTGKPSVRSLPTALVRADLAVCDLLAEHEPFVRVLAQCDGVRVGPELAKPPGSASQVHDRLEVYVPLGELIDASAEVCRLRTERDRLARLQAACHAKLQDPQFQARAPAEVLERQREQLGKLTEQLASIDRHLADLR
jgi:valyl-tRNA synthetase